MSINFGVIPVRCTFTLGSDQRFYQVARTSDSSNFPVSATLVIQWVDATAAVLATWSSTISTSTATWSVAKATVAALLALSPESGRVFYGDGASITDLLLAEGDIVDKSPAVS